MLYSVLDIAIYKSNTFTNEPFVCSFFIRFERTDFKRLAMAFATIIFFTIFVLTLRVLGLLFFV